VPVGPVLDQLSASLKQIEASLERHDLTDAELQDLRQQIDPISAAVSGALDRLTPRLDAKTRLDQLGPKPDDSSPPESPEYRRSATASKSSITTPASF
jgi:potassium efflux system protein